MSYEPTTHLKQVGLKELGFDPGPLDGIHGKRTQNAYNAFLKHRRGLQTEKPLLSPHAGGLTISQQSLDSIIYYETGGHSYYTNRLESPTWPGASSGATIGIGYDLGYNTPSGIARDWAGILTDAEISACQSVAGIKGRSAKASAKSISFVHVTFEEASQVFTDSTLPRFAELTRKAFPGVEKLRANAQGALLSLVFNRGSSMSGSRRREMREVRAHVATQDYEAIAASIRSMKRLWGRNLSGLHKRRDAEAKLVLSKTPSTTIEIRS